MHRCLIAICAATLAILVAGACTSFGESSDTGGDGGGADGAGADGGGADDGGAGTKPRCDRTKPFGSTKPFAAPIATPSATELGAFLSPDEKTMYLASSREGVEKLYVASAPGLAGMWSEPVPLGSVGVGGNAKSPSLTHDQLTLVFGSSRTGAMGGFDLWVATRTTTTSAFGMPTTIEGTNTPSDEHDPWINAMGDRLYYASERDGPAQLYVAQIAGPGFGAGVAITELNAAMEDEAPVLTADEKTIFFSSRRPGGLMNGRDVWAAQRDSPMAAFNAPVLVPLINSALDDYPTWVSEDGCEIIVKTIDNGKSTLFYASRP